MSRYKERLALLEGVAARLDAAGVPYQIKRFTPNAAPGSEHELWIPALVIGGGWRYVRVLYWSSVPMFTYPDPVTRYRTDDAGIDRLASVIVSEWQDHASRAQPPA